MNSIFYFRFFVILTFGLSCSGSGQAKVPPTRPNPEEIVTQFAISQNTKAEQFVSICGLPKVDPATCIEKNDLWGTRILGGMIHGELTSFRESEGIDFFTIHESKKILTNWLEYSKINMDFERVFKGLLVNVIENPRSGLRVEVEGMNTSSKICTREILEMIEANDQTSRILLSPEDPYRQLGYIIEKLYYIIVGALIGLIAISF